MRLKLIFPALLCLLSTTIFAQNLWTIGKESTVQLNSKTPLADIKAENRQAVGVLDFNNQTVQIELQMSEFQFPLSLMQEHFNNDFIESEKYPTAMFSGKISKELPTPENWKGEQKIMLVGWMDFHGKIQKMKIQGTLSFRNNTLIAKAVFPIILADFDVEIPTILTQKLAHTVEINVDLVFVSPTRLSMK